MVYIKKKEFDDIDLKIFEILRINKDGLKVKKIAELSNIKQRTIYNHLEKLEKKEIIINLISQKKWAIKQDVDSRLLFRNDIVCYFCDYDLIVEKHHIIQRKDGGVSEEWNLLPLCPNHHRLIHQNMFKIDGMNGLFILRSIEHTKKIIIPETERMFEDKKRRHPILISSWDNDNDDDEAVDEHLESQTIETTINGKRHIIYV